MKLLYYITGVPEGLVRVCAYCLEEVQSVGEDHLNYCENCQQIEGPTKEVTVEEYERRQS